MIVQRTALFVVLTAAALGAFGTSACSSDSSTADAGPAAQAGTVNAQSAKGSSTSYVGGVSQAVDQNKGQAALGTLIAGAQQAQGIVSPAVGSGARPANIKLSDAIGQVSQAITSCDTACTGTTCDFKGCGTSDGGTITINGTLSWTGGNLKCVNLTYDIDQSSVGGSKTKITLDCDVTVSASTIKGTIKSTGTTSIGGLLADAGAAASGIGDVGWSSETNFVDVKYANGKPTSGSVKVSATTTVAGQSYAGSAEVTFP